MDYKIIFFVVLIAGILFFLIKEINSISQNINEKSQKVIECVENHSRIIRSKMQNDVNNCVSKLKSINGEYMEQVRKMNDYASQPITNMSNGYSDSDSLTSPKNIIRHLSDCPEEILRGEVKNDKFYESESDDCIKKASERFNIRYNSDKPSDKKEVTVKQESDGSSNNKESKQSKHSNASKHSSNSKESEKKSKNHDKYVEINNSDTTGSEPSEYEDYVNSDSEEDDSKSTEKSSNDKPSDESDDDTELNSESGSDSDNGDDNTDTNESTQSDSTEGANVQLEHAKQPIKKPIMKQPSKQPSKQSNKQSKSQSSSPSDESKSSESDESSDSNESSNSSEFGKITIGSKTTGKNKKAPEIKLQSKSTKENKEKEDDLKSVNTTDVEALTLESLKPINSYNVEYLKNVAKRLSIPITQNKKPLKKDELYEKIRTKLIDTD